MFFLFFSHSRYRSTQQSTRTIICVVRKRNNVPNRIVSSSSSIEWCQQTFYASVKTVHSIPMFMRFYFNITARHQAKLWDLCKFLVLFKCVLREHYSVRRKSASHRIGCQQNTFFFSSVVSDWLWLCVCLCGVCMQQHRNVQITTTHHQRSGDKCEWTEKISEQQQPSENWMKNEKLHQVKTE